MSPTKAEITEWFGLVKQETIMRAFYDLFKVVPEYRDDYIWVTEAIRNQEGVLVLRNQRSWSVEATLAALDVLKYKGERARTDEETARFAGDINAGRFVIEDVLYEKMAKNRRGKKKGSQY